MRLVLVPVLMVCLCLSCPHDSEARSGPFELAYKDLEFIKKDKKKQVEGLLDRYRRLARAAAKDKIINSFFDINHRCFSGEGDVPAPTLRQLRSSFDRYYLENYYSFYDILFVSLEGDIFYSLRKESDLNVNIFKVDNNCKALSECLSRRLPQEAFIDFCMYAPSSEPASFFVEPVFKDGAHVGWIVLQLQINSINILFSRDINNGKAMESLLVNEDGCMLTDSLFLGDSTILQKYLSPSNINSKFEMGDGNKEVVDYRGRRVLSSFSVIEFMGAKWLLICKRDKSDVITKEYIDHRDVYNRHILDHLMKSEPSFVKSRGIPKGVLSHRVDIDEYAKASGDDVLETWGVATCVGIVATLPGQVGYLAHASNRDSVLRGDYTNLLDQMDYRLTRFDVTPGRKSEIRFFLIAPHLNAVVPAMEILTGKGYLLSQIYVLANTRAESARIVYFNKDGSIFVEWKSAAPGKDPISSMANARKVGDIVEDAIHEMYR